MNNVNQNKLVVLDVRAGLAVGIDPFTEIMAAKAKLAHDETLQIINTFEPVPLINKMRTMGYKSWTERPEAGVVHTFFKKESAEEVENELPRVETADDSTFQKKLVDYCNKIRKIDVRHLEMPEPMVNILKELETLDDGHALFVEHKQVPQFLLPELKNRNYTYLSNEIDSNQLQLLIFKEN